MVLITADMAKHGLTKKVFSFLNGSQKSLKGELLSWVEFFFLFQIIGEKEAEKATWFKKKMAPYLTMKKGSAGEKLFDEIQLFIAENEDRTSFFSGRIPVVFAVRLCSVVYQCVRLFHRCANKTERLLVSKTARAIVLASANEISIDAATTFYEEFSKVSSTDEQIGRGIIEKKIAKDPKLLRSVVEKNLFPVSDEFIESLPDSFVEGVYDSDFLTLCKRTGSKYLVDLLIKKRGSDKYFFGYIVDSLSSYSEKEPSVARRRMLPMIYHLVFVSKVADPDSHTFISVLPEYGSSENTVEEQNLIEDILDKLGEVYKKGTFFFSRFEGWYAYAPKVSTIDLYVQCWNENPGHRSIKDAMSAYRLCKDDRFKQLAFDHLYGAKEITSDMVELLDWLMSHDRLDYYQVRAYILSQNLIEKWWAAVDKTRSYVDDRKLFVQLARHFA